MGLYFYSYSFSGLLKQRAYMQLFRICRCS